MLFCIQVWIGSSLLTAADAEVGNLAGQGWQPKAVVGLALGCTVLMSVVAANLTRKFYRYAEGREGCASPAHGGCSR